MRKASKGSASGERWGELGVLGGGGVGPELLPKLDHGATIVGAPAEEVATAASSATGGQGASEEGPDGGDGEELAVAPTPGLRAAAANSGCGWGDGTPVDEEEATAVCGTGADGDCSTCSPALEPARGRAGDQESLDIASRRGSSLLATATSATSAWGSTAEQSDSSSGIAQAALE